ncbi:GNAT family N-acetyltransferase [Cryobacterium arcticum]|uniref:GNAT family N-acetyltransferase n=1 Tax=Cryobacterium arcticum TaxID=670052 RepID=A0A1B1BFS4_9MICO|nr:GNAT family N-acetyltransferase [Cryobacterium arcticum]ANP71363.1 GNAT family N-acetyltransferase [Cryobacterium arcticum]
MNAYTSVPIDPDSAATLQEQGLRLAVLDAADEAGLKRWLLADARGFHEITPSESTLEVQVEDIATDRVTGVWDASQADPDTPVATVRSWQMDLTVPGGAAVGTYAISSVTVSPTHRRQGIARAMLTAELRTAVRLGLPMAMLTVSEATIYGRYGFGPSARQSTYSVDTARARWTGPTPTGRVQFVSPESLLTDGPAVFERTRDRSPGEVDRREIWWKRTLGLLPNEPEAHKRGIRAVRYDDADGAMAGFALYEIALQNVSHPGKLTLVDLVAATDDAYAALWRFLIEMDMVDEIAAPLRSVSEPVAWQVADHRAVRKTGERDHLWLRILDVPAALAARRYTAPGHYLLDVTDDLGFATGRFLLTVAADGSGQAHPLTDSTAPEGTVEVSLSTADLASLYLGGTSAVDLARAGRITERTPDAAIRLDTALHSAYAPHLSTWF